MVASTVKFAVAVAGGDATAVLAAVAGRDAISLAGLDLNDTVAWVGASSVTGFDNALVDPKGLDTATATVAGAPYDGGWAAAGTAFVSLAAAGVEPPTLR